MVPSAIQTLTKKGFTVNVEENAGLGSKFMNDDYAASGAKIKVKKDVYDSDIILKVIKGKIDVYDSDIILKVNKKSKISKYIPSF